MAWILLAVLIAALAANFGGTSRQTDKPAGIFLTLLLAAAAGLYCAKAGIDVTANIIIKTSDVGGNLAAGNGLTSTDSSESWGLPSFGVSVFRALIGVPLTLTAVVLIIKNQFTAREQDIPEATGRRFRLSILSSVLMIVTLIASIVTIVPHLKEIVAVTVLFLYIFAIVLLISLVCPVLLLAAVMIAGVETVFLLKFLTLPIMLFFAASAFYLVSAVCGVSFAVKGIKLSGLKKRYMIPFILLGLIPGANNVTYFVLPKFVGKHS